MIALLDRAEVESDLAALYEMSDDSGEPAPTALIRRLTHLEYTLDEARALLLSAVRHRSEMEAALGRPVGARVALFDLLISVQRKVFSPKLIELPLFESIQRSAITDHLTGLSNRSYLESRLESEIRRARRYGEHLSVLLLDLDDFKAINDTRGHVTGDRVLTEVGGIVQRSVRDVDIAARFGGEEFLVVLPETPRIGALVVAERVRENVEKHFRRRHDNGKAIKLTLSGGLACYPEDAEDPSTLISRADSALYRAKRHGKNSIEVFFQEKRRAERIGVHEQRVKAMLRGEVGNGPVRRSGTVKNISEGGLLVEIAEPVPVGSRVQVSFSLGSSDAYSFPSTVVRIEEREPGGEAGAGRRSRRFEAGLRFQRRARVLQPALDKLARQQLAAG
jgi:diguanylate cyclase (GGDEF)-like protein